MKKIVILILTLVITIPFVFSQKSGQEGKLYIIGGGKRPVSMMEDIIQESGIDVDKDYGIIFPMSSEEPDSAYFYGKLSFEKAGFENLLNFNIQNEKQMTASKLDSIRNCKLIYLSGGDQNKFMKIVNGTPLHLAILDAYKNGALIAGTSAGAAVQSKKMITGNELKYEEYTGRYRTIEAENIEVAEGLGLLEGVIIDQHFIWRMRMNRLISAAIENPEEVLIGIDESTAILVEGKKISVRGKSQIVVLSNSERNKKIKNGLLGAENMTLCIYLPGDSFYLP
jgi:cyanophycinase